MTTPTTMPGLVAARRPVDRHQRRRCRPGRARRRCRPARPAAARARRGRRCRGAGRAAPSARSRPAGAAARSARLDDRGDDAGARAGRRTARRRAVRHAVRRRRCGPARRTSSMPGAHGQRRDGPLQGGQLVAAARRSTGQMYRKTWFMSSGRRRRRVRPAPAGSPPGRRERRSACGSERPARPASRTTAQLAHLRQRDEPLVGSGCPAPRSGRAARPPAPRSRVIRKSRSRQRLSRCADHRVHARGPGRPRRARPAPGRKVK